MLTGAAQIAFFVKSNPFKHVKMQKTRRRYYSTVLSNLFDTAGHLVNFPPADGPQSRGAWPARGARAYKGIWGRSLQRGPGAEPLVEGSRRRSPPEAETLFASECSMETANSPIFLKFGNAKDHQTLLNFASWFYLTNHQTKTTIYVRRRRATWNHCYSI